MRKSYLLALFILFPSVAGAESPPVSVVNQLGFDASTSCTLEPLAGFANAARTDGLRVIAGVRLHNAGPGDTEVRQCPEVIVSMPAPQGPCYQVEATTTLTAMPQAPFVTSWLPFERKDADRIEVRVPVAAGAPVVDVRVVAGAPVADVEWVMLPEAADTAPLGNRLPVFMVHGFVSEDSLLPFDPARCTDFSVLQAMPEYKESFKKFKYYYFDYRPWQDYHAVAAGLATEIKKVLAADASPTTPFLIVGRSGGAIPTRYVTADPELAPRHLGTITLCGAMRGSVGAALLHANGWVAERIGIAHYLLLHLTQRTYPFSPMLDSLVFDNYDGTIDPTALTKYGLMENKALRDFNEKSTDAGKIIAHMGDVTSLWGWGAYHVGDELNREVMAAFHPSWGSADPLVHRPSGTLAGKDLRGIRLVPNREHGEFMTDPVLLRAFLLDLYQLGTTGRFDALWSRADRGIGTIGLFTSPIH